MTGLIMTNKWAYYRLICIGCPRDSSSVGGDNKMLFQGGQNFGPHPGGPGGVPGQETPTLNQLLQSPSQRFHGPGPGGHGPGFPGSHQPWTAGHRPPGMGHPGYPGHPGMNPYAGHPGMIPPGHPAANGQHLRNGPPGMYGPRHPQYNHGQPHGDQLQERLPVPPNHPSQNPAHAPNYSQPRLPTTPHHHQVKCDALFLDFK